MRSVADGHADAAAQTEPARISHHGRVSADVASDTKAFDREEQGPRLRAAAAATTNDLPMSRAGGGEPPPDQREQSTMFD